MDYEEEMRADPLFTEKRSEKEISHEVEGCVVLKVFFIRKLKLLVYTRYSFFL